MRRIGIIICATVAIGAVLFPNTKAQAGGEGVAAGLIGGLVGGAIIGSALSQPRYYYPEPYPVEVEVEGPPPYGAGAPYGFAPACYWTRGAPVWDGYRGMWVRPRIQVCD